MWTAANSLHRLVLMGKSQVWSHCTIPVIKRFVIKLTEDMWCLSMENNIKIRSGGNTQCIMLDKDDTVNINIMWIMQCASVTCPYVKMFNLHTVKYYIRKSSSHKTRLLGTVVLFFFICTCTVDLPFFYINDLTLLQGCVGEPTPSPLCLVASLRMFYRKQFTP